MARGSRGGGGAARTRPQPLHWRPVFSVGSLLWGLFLGLGSAVLLQQYGLRVLTRGALLQSVAAAVVLAVVLPSIGRAVGVRRYNSKLRKAGLA